MTNKEAITRIKDHKIVHKMLEPRAIYISEALDMAINALKIFEQAKEAGFRGEEVEFYIGGRKFAIRELAQ